MRNISTWQWRKRAADLPQRFSQALRSVFPGTPEEEEDEDDSETRIRRIVRRVIPDTNGDDGTPTTPGDGGDTPTTPGDGGDDDTPQWPATPSEGRLAWVSTRPHIFWIQGVNDGRATVPIPTQVGKVTARAGGESPSRYSLLGSPSGINLGADGSLWITRLPTTESTDNAPDEPMWDFHVAAFLREQQISTRVRIYLTAQEGLQEIRSDTAAPDLPSHAANAGWTWALPLPVLIPDVNFRGLVTAITNARQWYRFGVSLGQAVIGTFGNIIDGRWQIDRPRWNVENPFSADDFPLLHEWGGVILHPGYLRLDDAFILDEPDAFIADYQARIDDGRLEVAVKPFLPPNSNKIEDYGIYAVWGPREAHAGDINATLTITARISGGGSHRIEYNVRSINPNKYAVPPRDPVTAVISRPVYNTLFFPRWRMPLPDGIYQEQVVLDYNSAADNGLYFPAVGLGGQGVSNFGDTMRAQVPIDEVSGSVAQNVRTGGAVKWRIRWVNSAGQSGSLRIVPDSWYPDIVPAGLRTITTRGFVPPANNEYRDRAGASNEQDVGNPGGIPLGNFLTMKGSASGFFSFWASSYQGQGSTVVEIEPYFVNWHQWHLPVPFVGALGRKFFGFLGSVVSDRIVELGARQQAAREALDALQRARQQIAARGGLLAKGLTSGGKYYRDQARLFALRRVGAVTGSIGVTAGSVFVRREAQHALLEQAANTANRQLHQSFREVEENPALGFDDIGETGWSTPPVFGNAYFVGDKICGMFHTVEPGTFAAATAAAADDGNDGSDSGGAS